MPQTKLQKFVKESKRKQKEVPFATVARYLKGYDLVPVKLAAVLGCAPNTAKERLENPCDLRLGELMKLNHCGLLPADEIYSTIKE